jgi:hypothetical protein
LAKEFIDEPSTPDISSKDIGTSRNNDKKKERNGRNSREDSSKQIV